MLEAIERHARALAAARTFRHPHSVIRFANNGTFELAHTYNFGLSFTPPNVARTNPPDRWLQGACLRLERQGMMPREAIAQAVSEWREQEALEKMHGRQSPKRNR